MRDWHDKHYAFFQNTACEFFPCHETRFPERFNCLFCYCPLYTLGHDCGGNFRYTENGVKDCTGCMIPHERENYGRVTARFQELCSRMQALEQKRAAEEAEDKS